MPYIDQKAREKFRGQWGLKGFIDKCTSPGELNYLITKMLIWWAKKNGESYTTYNEVIGVLECAKQEFYSRQVRVLEDQKIVDNGDVY